MEGSRLFVGTSQSGTELEMNQDETNEYRKKLASFSNELKTYFDHPTGYYNDSTRTKLQRQVPRISSIVAKVHGGGNYTQNKQNYSFSSVLSFVTQENAPTSDNWENVKAHVERVINEAIGCIDDQLFPSEKTTPILEIRDQILKSRCLDLLNAPGNFDRVIREATLILEERLRTSIPYEKLCELIPQSKEQIGEPLANKLLSSNEPIIIVSDKPQERIAFHKMVVGIIAYLRNPSHHSLNDETEWSLAWSVVGLIDNLLSELVNSYVTKENRLETKEGKSK